MKKQLHYISTCVRYSAELWVDLQHEGRRSDKKDKKKKKHNLLSHARAGKKDVHNLYWQATKVLFNLWLNTDFIKPDTTPEMPGILTVLSSVLQRYQVVVFDSQTL